VVAIALLLLTPYGREMSTFVRPYSLAMWLSAWSSLLFLPLLVGGGRLRDYVGFVVVSTLAAYSLAMTGWVLLVEAVVVGGAAAAAAAREGVAAAVRRHRPLALALAAVLALSLPYVAAAARLQGHIGHPSAANSMRAALTPKYYVSGPLYLLAMPAGLGYAAAALSVVGAAVAVWRRDRVGMFLAVLVAAQIALTHGFLEGRSGFAFRYLAPAFPALCLLAASGAENLIVRLPGRRAIVTAGAGAALVAAAASAHDARPSIGPWREVAADLRDQPGRKVVFFDIGWDAQRLEYEARHDAQVCVRSDRGPGWGAGGRLMTAGYVRSVTTRESSEARMFFYQLDPVWRRSVFDEAFTPEMARLGCALAYERRVPSYARDDPEGTGAVIVGYRCHGG
jgi:hypothetical protein